MSDESKCPKCGAAFDGKLLPIGSSFACQSWMTPNGDFDQSDTCRIAYLTAPPAHAALAEAARERDQIVIATINEHIETFERSAKVYEAGHPSRARFNMAANAMIELRKEIAAALAAYDAAKEA